MPDQPKHSISVEKAFLLCVVVAVVTYYATANAYRVQPKPTEDTAMTAAATQPPASQEPVSFPLEEPSPAPPDYYTVSSVIEPTVVKLTDGTDVRLIGVVPPIEEVGESVEREALGFTKRLVEGKRVRLELEPELEKDSTGRTLAYVYLENGKLLNAEIIKRGYGSASTAYAFHLSRDFNRYELSAQNRGLGVWNVASDSEFEDSTEAASTSTTSSVSAVTVAAPPMPLPTVAPSRRTYAPSAAESYSNPSESYVPNYSPPRPTYQPPVAENGSYYGEISERTGRPKTVLVSGYTRRDGTYVRGYYRSTPRRH